MRSSLIVSSLLLLGIGTAQAQTLGTPIFKSPYRDFKQSEIAGYISDPGEGVNLALEGEFRFARPRFDFGLHGAYIDYNGPNGGAGAVGIDGRATLARHTEAFPLDASVTAGFGIVFNDGNTGFLVPFGVSLGREVELENSKVTFVPYVHPVLAPSFGDLYDGVQFGLGLGVDINLSPQLAVRVSGAVGDYEGVGIGLAWHR